MLGKVVMFNNQKGYGFINASNGNDIFFHKSNILDSNRVDIKISKGQKVEFDIETNERGNHATNIKFID